ncbi:hypothetical protein ABK040_003139 [Willaertia magna]
MLAINQFVSSASSYLSNFSNKLTESFPELITNLTNKKQNVLSTNCKVIQRIVRANQMDLTTNEINLNSLQKYINLQNNLDKNLIYLFKKIIGGGNFTLFLTNEDFLFINFTNSYWNRFDGLTEIDVDIFQFDYVSLLLKELSNIKNSQLKEILYNDENTFILKEIYCDYSSIIFQMKNDLIFVICEKTLKNYLILDFINLQNTLQNTLQPFRKLKKIITNSFTMQHVFIDENDIFDFYYPNNNLTAEMEIMDKEIDLKLLKDKIILKIEFNYNYNFFITRNKENQTELYFYCKRSDLGFKMNVLQLLELPFKEEIKDFSCCFSNSTILLENNDIWFLSKKLKFEKFEIYGKNIDFLEPSMITLNQQKKNHNNFNNNEEMINKASGSNVVSEENTKKKLNFGSFKAKKILSSSKIIYILGKDLIRNRYGFIEIYLQYFYNKPKEIVTKYYEFGNEIDIYSNDIVIGGWHVIIYRNRDRSLITKESKLFRKNLVKHVKVNNNLSDIDFQFI